VTAWDDLAADYDRTRGGEERGDQYAFAEISRPALEALGRLPPDPVTRRGLGEIVTIETA